MSKLYVVVQVSPKRRCDYKNGWIREETSVGVPYVLSDYEEAHKRAKEKQDARVPAFVKEFPFNPLDDEIGKLKDENEKLRELVRDMYLCSDPCCDCPHHVFGEGYFCDLGMGWKLRRIRELGIEVDG